jgi:hypothetical protein
MDRYLCSQFLIDFYRSHLSQRILNKIAEIQKCDCLRFEFPDVCVSTNLKTDFERDQSHLFSEFDDYQDKNKLFYEKIIVKKRSILMFFAITKFHQESPKRCFSFVGTLEQLKIELKPYFRLFDVCSILEFSKDGEDVQTLPTLPIGHSESKTNIMKSNFDSFRNANKLENLNEFLNQ